MREKDIRKLADQMMILEKNIDTDSNAEESKQEIEKIMLSLSIDDLFQLISYLSENFEYKKDF